MATGRNLRSASVSQMVEVVSAVSGLSTKVQTIPLGDEDTLLSLINRVGVPAVGVVYMGVQSAVTDLKQKGLAADITVDLYLLHPETTQDRVSDIEADALDLNEQIADAVKHTCPAGGRPWRFVYEVPVPTERYLLYVQRWASRMIMT